MTAVTLPKSARRKRGTAPTVEELLAAAVGAVPGGTDRPGQRTMANAITEAIRTRRHLLVQAGTGTGKSLAYLVPALLVDGPVVISTATLALQSQLVEHDLPRLVKAVHPLLGRRPTFAVLKGRHHYVCMAKVDGGVADEQDALFDAQEGQPVRWLGEAGRLSQQIIRLREWALETETGDRDELDPGVDELTWRLNSTPARECVGAGRCAYGDDCFAEASRVRAREADIVITNHSLLAVDMLAEHQILPEHELLIIDEAHELAERVSSAAQAELTADLVKRAIRSARPLVEAAYVEPLTEAQEGLEVCLIGAPSGRLAEGLPEPLAEVLLLLDAGARRCYDAIGEVKADDASALDKQQARTMLGDLSLVAQRLLGQQPADVTWIEGDDRNRNAIVVAPLSVAGTLGSHLYTDRTVVATSATLTLGGNFDSMARSLGLLVDPRAGGRKTEAIQSDRAEDADEPDEEADAKLPDWDSLDVGSPFNYPKQGILYVAARLPRPSVSGLPDAAATELVELVTALGGRTLGLFSSRKAAERATEVLRERTDLTVLLQGEEALPILVRRFREEQDSCLMGVMSLWQGVDVPGDACQLVVIDRLPFPRPDEPLAAARSAAVDAAGGSGFAAVSVPIAAIRLAQGVGRLVRTATDRGVVAVLDSRLETARSYGPFLRRTLPPFWYTTEPEVVRAALRRLATPQ